ncbi:MAG TPA: hypothetical protein VMV06_01460 [Acidimicrobiales bacterium]|nr:hypothetical protein [Acidimicrobiales bacterium]
MTTPRSAGRHASDRQVRLRRDAALERIRSITTTVGIASVAAVAAFGVYLSRALPGHTSVPAGTTVSPPVTSPSTGGDSSGAQSSTNLAPPSSPPIPSQQPAPVVTGSS